MTSCERVLRALNFKKPDRLAKDLGAMPSTGISAFAYPKLVEALGLPPRRPRVHDTFQMLALPDIDVLDALGCDVVTIDWGVTNAFDEPEKWQEFDFNGRLPARVRDRSAFEVRQDGIIINNLQPQLKAKMPPSSYVFDAEHGGQPLSLTNDIPLEDLDKIKKELKGRQLKDEDVKKISEHCKRCREASNRAILFNGQLLAEIGLASHGGLGVFPVLCLTEPGYVADLHEIKIEHTIRDVRMLLPEINRYVDIILAGADDWGTQNSLIASPDIFRRLFKPYLRRLNDEFHKIAPQIKTFLHCCGAVYDLIDDIIDSGFDILNPVQWTAGGHSYKEWKDKSRGRIALWGGGVNAQVTLPLGSVEEIEREVGEVVSYMSEDDGYVFNSIHNILAEIPPEKIIAMYKTAETVETIRKGSKSWR
jgi:uroporphyrinogen decarboxylase